ncbi:ABC transporter substrate-binding protein [Chitinimonas sp. BJYL2]|uniref:substrate-binding periplasmic protein n=1 Tax=Chitinimonas sp. BJYL2 TaxID=2976696 RepID=UPI0022B47A86|nr:transporter substrate-binding domain-containing protein [Chitinimonas sp. BJYL2]
MALRFRFSLARAWLILALSALICTMPALAAPLIYPRPEAPEDPQLEYPVALLKLALSKAGVRADIRPSGLVTPQGRALRLLANGQGIDVMWTMTSREREAELMPICIPIYKGLMGYRIALVRKAETELFANVHAAADLRRFVAGQGHDWPDTDILRANSLKVQAAVSYGSLFQMLAAKRYDYFPRSVIEIWGEAERHKSAGIVVEPYVLIYYPTASYYFVSKKNPALASVIQRGLEAAIADGSFDALFKARYGQVIKQVQAAKRRLIVLENPDLPEGTPLHIPAYWYRFGK